ncbi:NAD-dependent epimerase/dehydratase family protein [Polynucleobacter paneuropaeus]|nr:NAD-dependent epimerase/dehydratase family protein [Polynucleobacter paneuropaeus]
MKILILGGAGLVGQNLVARLIMKGFKNLIVIDKNKQNLDILLSVQPDILGVHADLSKPGNWESYFNSADAVVMLQAQIGGLFYQEFFDNNVKSTGLILDQVKSKNIPCLVHISSSVVESIADDFYTRSKIEQEKMVLASNIPCPILRPTLMFGWFDRKHLGWLSRLMQKIPIFPIPGSGRYMRQPLYVGDFCDVIISCIEKKIPAGIFNISGHEKIDYIDMIRMIKKATHAKAAIVKIPYSIFYCLLWFWALFDKNPPFTTQQLQALVARDEFEVTDWPKIFAVPCTPFEIAIEETFNHPIYSKVVLKF